MQQESKFPIFHNPEEVLIIFSRKGGLNVAYVDDEVHGHIQAAKLGRTGERYVLGGENLTIKESFDRISKTISGRSPKLKAPHGLVKAVVKTFDFIGDVTGLQPWVSSDLIASMGIRIQVV